MNQARGIALLLNFCLAAEASPNDQSVRDAACVDLPFVARTSVADPAFLDLRQRGLSVCRFGQGEVLMVPLSCRHVPMDGHRFVEQVAEFNGLSLWWAADRKVAVIHSGGEDLAVARFLADLAERDPRRRKDAVWRAKWIRDIRIVRPLLELALGKEEALAEASLDVLTAQGLAAALAAEPGLAGGLLQREGVSGRELQERAALAALGWVGGSDAARFLQDAALSRRAWWRYEALRSAGGWSDLARCQKALEDRSTQIGDFLGCVGSNSGKGFLPLVQGQLTNSYVHLRVEAIRALGRLGGEEAFRLLEEQLQDPDPMLRGHAVVSLGDWADNRARGLLLKACADPNPKVRGASLVTLARAGHAVAADAVRDSRRRFGIARIVPDREWVCEPRVVDDTDEIAAYALGLAGGDGSRKILIEMAGGLGTSERGRRAAVLALGEVGGEAAVVELARLLGVADAECAGRKPIGLLYQGDRLVTTVPRFDVYETSSERVLLDGAGNRRAIAGAKATRSVVIDALAKIGTPSATNVLWNEIRATNSAVRAAAVRAVRSWDSVQELRGLASSGEEGEVRVAAVEALVRIGTPAAVAQLQSLCTNCGSDVEFALVRESSRLNGEAACRVLHALVSSADAGVRIFAYESLGKVGGSTAEGILGAKGLRDEDETIRGMVGDTLFALSGTNWVWRLEAMLREPDPRIRCCALGNMLAFHENSVDVIHGYIGGELDRTVLEFIRKKLSRNLRGEGGKSAEILRVLDDRLPKPQEPKVEPGH